MIGYDIEQTYDDMKKSDNNLTVADIYKHELYGMFRSLYCTNYITKDEYYSLFYDTQNEHYKVFKTILNT